MRSVRSLILVLLLALPAASQPVLRWGGDSEGGAPFVEADPNDPGKVDGFDVDVAEEIAKGLGRRARFVQVVRVDRPVRHGAVASMNHPSP